MNTVKLNQEKVESYEERNYIIWRTYGEVNNATVDTYFLFGEKNGFARNSHIRRELIKTSLEVHKLGENGALEIGICFRFLAKLTQSSIGEIVHKEISITFDMQYRYCKA